MKLRNLLAIALLCMSVASKTFTMEPDQDSTDPRISALLSQLSSSSTSFLDSGSFDVPQSNEGFNSNYGSSIDINSFKSLIQSIADSDRVEANLVKLLFYPMSSNALPKGLVPALHYVYHNRSSFTETGSKNGYKPPFADYLKSNFQIAHRQASDAIHYEIFCAAVSLIENLVFEVLSHDDVLNDVLFEKIDTEIRVFRKQIFSLLRSKQLAQDKIALKKLFAEIPVIKSLIQANKVVLSQLLLAYAQVLISYKVESEDKSAEQCATARPSLFESLKKVHPDFYESAVNTNKSYFAGATQRPLMQFSKIVDDHMLEQQLEYDYLAASHAKQRYEIVIKSINSGKIHSPVVINYLVCCLQSTKICMPKECNQVLQLINDRLCIDGCRYLCPDIYKDTLLLALKVAKKFENSSLFNSLSKKVLLRVDHIVAGNASHSGDKPSGSHVLLDEADIEDIEIDNSLLATGSKLQLFEFMYNNEKYRISGTIENRRAQILPEKEYQIYNPNNDVSYSPLKMKMIADYCFTLTKEDSKKKFRMISPMSSDEAITNKVLHEFVEIFESHVAPHYHIERVGNVTPKQYGFKLTCCSEAFKRMGSSFFPKELTSNLKKFFCLLEDAYCTMPTGSINLKVDNNGFYIDSANGLAKGLFEVCDEFKRKHLVEMYFRQLDPDFPIIRIMTAFDHLASIELDQSASYPKFFTDNEGTVYDLTREFEFNQELESLSTKSLEKALKADSLNGIFKNQASSFFHVGVLDVNIQDFYKPSKFGITLPKLPMLIRIPKNKLDRLCNSIYNKHILLINLTDFGRIPGFLTLHSTDQNSDGSEFRIASAESFMLKLNSALMKALNNYQNCPELFSHTQGKLQIIFYFEELEKHVNDNGKFYAKDRLMAIMSKEYRNQLKLSQ